MQQKIQDLINCNSSRRACFCLSEGRVYSRTVYVLILYVNFWFQSLFFIITKCFRSHSPLLYWVFNPRSFDSFQILLEKSHLDPFRINYPILPRLVWFLLKNKRSSWIFAGQKERKQLILCTRIAVPNNTKFVFASVVLQEIEYLAFWHARAHHIL